jgi:hypothetical protein
VTDAIELRGRALWEARIRSRSKWAFRNARWAAREATGPLRALPDFLVIGAAKSGTTSLFSYLSEHPLVCPPVTKEIRYFAYHSDRSPNWYRAHFPLRRDIARTGRARGGTAITGDGTPSYLSHPMAAARAAALVPDARLVAVLRNPVDRAISAYHFARKYHGEERSIEDAFAENFRWCELDVSNKLHDDFPNSVYTRHNYVLRGHYAEQLQWWLRFYDREQLLVIETEQVSRNGDGFARVLDHLGLPTWQPASYPEHNAGSYAPAPDSVRAALARHFEPLNEALCELLGEDFGWYEQASRAG